MMNDKKIKSSKFSLSRWLSHKWFVQNIPFFLFVSILTVLYIYNGHYSDKTIKDISKTNRELKELQYEYKSLRSEVMFRSKQSELAKATEPMGLKPLLTPPVIIHDSTAKHDQ